MDYNMPQVPPYKTSSGQEHLTQEKGKEPEAKISWRLIKGLVIYEG